MSKHVLSLYLLCWCAAVSLSAGDPTGTKCEAMEGAPSCVCRSPKGVIDLTKIANFDGIPRFSGLKDPFGFSYDYNPCAGFKGPYECADVQICQHTKDGDYALEIADVKSEAIWIDTDGEPYVYYVGPGGREVIVHLVCDSSATEPVVTTTGDSYVYLRYEFTVRSVHACPSGNGTLPRDRCEAVVGAPSCVCKTPDGVIDLTKIASYDGNPRFTGIKDSDNYSYYYNPCFYFSETEACSNVHICQKAPNSNHAIANNGSELMKIDEQNGKVYVHYIGPDGREALVYLNCDQSERGEPILTTTGDSEIFFRYMFNLTSCHACPGGCSAEDTKERNRPTVS